MRFFFTFFNILLVFQVFALQENKTPVIYVDNKGVMRWSDTSGEASFYGVNYTLPFAHAWRAINYMGKDHKEAIDKDVYHFSRLGFNAYRIHIWDVEISDDKGHLLKNDHLDLLDYLIAKLREKDIRILLTTMTNFGNGYPERNQNTGAFSYLYDKCAIHSNKEAIAAQEIYIQQLVSHVNPYTGQAYKDDPFVVGFEINNEPCHAGDLSQTKVYINKMLSALKKAGNKKPVFYNVSHNMSYTEAYYGTDIQGTTYQWYPIGLVAGHTRKGNFLPYVDEYNISFESIKNFDKKAKAVYEFDPADITYSYMYPAMTRTFRSRGFQWITQFAYDPMDMAWANTEYQTHFLNLAYTPGKAVSMKIAAEAAYSVPRNKQYEKYPNDTVFDNFRVSYINDLSELNSPGKFFYSNNTDSSPIAPDQLVAVVGCGSSPVIKYEGTGAYFADKLEDGLWRLEVMPDAIRIEDPFAKTSLKKEVVTIAWNQWNMDIRLPGLGENFTVEGINEPNSYRGAATGTVITVKPGVYLARRANYEPVTPWKGDMRWNHIALGEFAAPTAHAKTFSVVHKPAKVMEQNQPLLIRAQIVGPSFPDSVIVYTDKISFWADNNPHLKMKRTTGYTYEATIPSGMTKESIYRYNIVVCNGSETHTFPSNVAGNPLDWDFYSNEYYETEIVKPDNPVELVRITDDYSLIGLYGVPETSRINGRLNTGSPDKAKSLKFSFKVNDPDARFFWRKWIKDDVINRAEGMQNARYLCVDVRNAENIRKLNIGFVTRDGFTYTSVVDLTNNETIIKVPLSGLVQDKTTLLPAPYPTFLEQYFIPQSEIPFNILNIEMVQLSTVDTIDEKATLELGNIWLD